MYVWVAARVRKRLCDSQNPTASAIASSILWIDSSSCYALGHVFTITITFHQPNFIAPQFFWLWLTLASAARCGPKQRRAEKKRKIWERSLAHSGVIASTSLGRWQIQSVTSVLKEISPKTAPMEARTSVLLKMVGSHSCCLPPPSLLWMLGWLTGQKCRMPNRSLGGITLPLKFTFHRPLHWLEIPIQEFERFRIVNRSLLNWLKSKRRIVISE